MLKKLFAVVAVAALFTTACGDSDDEATPETTEAPTATEPSATDAPTTEAPTTEAPTTEAPTTEAPADDALLDLGRSVVGTWSGEWTNTTFGSTGPISGTITLDEDARELTVDSDVGGNVFGAADPDPELLTLPLTEGEHTGTSPTFGDWTLTMSADGTFSIVSTAIATLPGGTFTMDGALTDTGIDATYVVDFGSGDPAEGVVTITKT